MYLRKRLLRPVSFLYNPKTQAIRHTRLRKELKNLAPSLPELAASPWGISPHSLHFFEKLKQELQLNLSVPTWKEEYFRLTGRQTAAECLERIRQLLPDLPIPATPKILQKDQGNRKIPDPAKCPFCCKDSLFFIRTRFALDTGA